MMVDPWGEVLAMAAPEGDQVLVADLDRNEVVRRREQMPVLSVRRPDVYDLPVVNANVVAPSYLQPPD
jgi:predicted amidohydrolase